MINKPEYDWEIIGHWVNEGPAVIKRNGNRKIFISYSASATTTITVWAYLPPQKRVTYWTRIHGANHQRQYLKVTMKQDNMEDSNITVFSHNLTTKIVMKYEYNNDLSRICYY